MLVYLKEPMGVSSIQGTRVYGRCYSYGSFGPTIVPREVFYKNRDILEEAPITSQWIKEKTGLEAPGQVNFLTTEFSKLDFDQTVDVARALGINYIKSAKPTLEEKKALRRSIINRIEKLQGVR